MRTDQTQFKTTSLTLAIFLCTKGQRVVAMTKGGYKKEFAFIETPALLRLIEKYKFGPSEESDLLVPVHAYEYARNELLDRLNE